jgi:gas vesicle protein
MANNSKTKKFALGALVGGLAGYLTGVLTAPKSGRETREDIANKADSIKSGAEQQLQDVIDELNSTIDDLKSKSLALSAKAREEYDERLMQAKDARNKANLVMKAVKAGEAEDPELNKAVKQGRQAAKNLVKYLKG